VHRDILFIEKINNLNLFFSKKNCMNCFTHTITNIDDKEILLDIRPFAFDKLTKYKEFIGKRSLQRVITESGKIGTILGVDVDGEVVVKFDNEYILYFSPPNLFFLNYTSQNKQLLKEINDLRTIDKYKKKKNLFINNKNVF
jgi:hypothetical protein